MENTNSRLFGLTRIAEISQILSLAIQIFGVPKDYSVILTTIFYTITSLGITAGSMLLLRLYRYRVLQKENLPRATNLIRSTVITLLFVIALSALYPAIQTYRAFTADRIIVMVADFAEKGNPQSPDKTTGQLVFERLQQTLGNQKDVEIQKLSNPVDGLSSQSAIEIGRRNGATIVIWGWYTLRQNDVLINPYFEIMADYRSLQSGWVEQQVIPRGTFESFDFEISLSKDFSTLSGFTIGTIRRLQHRYSESIEILTKTIEQSTSSKHLAELFNMRGLAYFESGKTQEAINDFSKAIELDKGNFVYFFNLGSIQMNAKITNEAIANLKRSTELNPKFSRPINLLGVIFYRQENLSLAEAYFTQAIALDPKDSVYRSNIATVYADIAKPTLALEQIDIALQTNPTNQYLHSLKRDLLFSQQQILPSIWETLLSFYYLQPLTFNLILIVLLALVAFYSVDKRSKGRLSNWLFVNTLLGIGELILKLCMFRNRRQKPLNTLLSKVIAFGVRLQMESYSFANNQSKAFALAEAAVSRNIRDVRLFNRLGTFYLEQSTYDMARKTFSETLKMESKNSLAHFCLGRIYLEMNDFQKSIYHFQQATANEFELAAWVSAGDLHWKKQHDFRGALVTWRKAINKDPQFVIDMTKAKLSDISNLQSAEEHLKLGLAFQKIGDTKRAVIGFVEANKLAKHSIIADFSKNQLAKIRNSA